MSPGRTNVSSAPKRRRPTPGSQERPEPGPGGTVIPSASLQPEKFGRKGPFSGVSLRHSCLKGLAQDGLAVRILSAGVGRPGDRSASG